MKRHAIESAVSTAVGFCLSLIVQICVFSLNRRSVAVSAIMVTSILTLLSFARQWAVRAWFARYEN